MIERIMALCGAMGADDSQEELLLPLVRAVQDLLAGRLRPGIVPENCEPAFSLAAAMMAMDRLSGMPGGGSAGEAVSFTAGDLTIRRESGNQTSGSLSEQAEGLLAPWLRDGGFVFRGVEG